MAYSSSGRLAFAGVAALWVWAASTAFVSSNNGAKALRGVERGSNAEYTPFAAAPEMGEQNVRSVNSGMQAVLLAGVVGLMAGLAPVRAEEAAPAEAAPAPATESSFSFEKKKESTPYTDVPKSKFKKTKKVTASAAVSEDDSGKKKRVIISPADELDEDELSPTRPNQPLLFLFFATPVTIYLTFYVLGSLNVIWAARTAQFSQLVICLLRRAESLKDSSSQSSQI